MEGPKHEVAIAKRNTRTYHMKENKKAARSYLEIDFLLSEAGEVFHVRRELNAVLNRLHLTKLGDRG